MPTPRRQDHLAGQDVQLIQGNGFFKTVVIHTPIGVVLIDAGESISHLEVVVKKLDPLEVGHLAVLIAGCGGRAYLQAAKQFATQAGFKCDNVHIYSGDCFFGGFTSTSMVGSGDACLRVKESVCGEVLVSIFDVEFKLLDVSTLTQFELAVYMPEHATLVVGSIADELNVSSIESIRSSSLSALNRRVRLIDRLLSLGAEHLLPLGAEPAIFEGVEKKLTGLFETAKFMRARKLRAPRNTQLDNLCSQPVGANVNHNLTTH